MPMFDNPKKELQRLQEQLLWEEEDQPEEFSEDEEDLVFEDLFEDDFDEDYPPEHHVRSGHRKNSIFDEIEDAFEDEDEEPFALFVEERRGLFGRKKRRPAGQGSHRGLQITLLLEIIGILGILIWWVVMKL